MIKTKQAFTMTELVFVIVIIGILASVAIPRLAATRDEAKAVICMSQAQLALQDIQNYYTANGKLSNVSKMTNIAINVDTTVNTNGFSSDLDLNNGSSIEFLCEGGYFATFVVENNVTVHKITILNPTASEVGALSINNSAMVRNKGRVATLAAISIKDSGFYGTHILSGKNLKF